MLSIFALVALLLGGSITQHDVLNDGPSKVSTAGVANGGPSVTVYDGLPGGPSLTVDDGLPGGPSH